ncbi:MAG: hypothetical protein WBV62_15610, partial [Roseobacter sp.]
LYLMEVFSPKWPLEALESMAAKSALFKFERLQILRTRRKSALAGRTAAVAWYGGRRLWAYSVEKLLRKKTSAII